MLSKQNTRFQILDIFRILAISLIVMVHIAQTIGNPLGAHFTIFGFYSTTWGGIGVTIFLILSGLVLGLKYDSIKTNQILHFLKNRIIRIYPTYYISIFIGVCFLLFLTIYQSKTIDYFLDILHTVFLTPQLFLLISGLYAFAGQWGGVLSPASWFIGLIMSMYVVFPTLLYCIKRKPNTSLLLTLIITLLSQFLIKNYNLLSGRPLDWFPLCRIFEFTLGLYLSHMLPKNTWGIINIKTFAISQSINFFSAVSFPLFLINSIFKPIIVLFLAQGYGYIKTISLYLLICILVSTLLLIIEQKFILFFKKS